MKKLSLTALASPILGVLVGEGLASLPAYAAQAAGPVTGSVQLTADLVGTGEGSTDADRYKGQVTVTAAFSIAEKIDASGNTVFDPAGTSTVTLSGTGFNFVTPPIPVTGAIFKGNLVASFSFMGSTTVAGGTGWFSGKTTVNGQTGLISSSTINGDITINPGTQSNTKPTGKGDIKASYTGVILVGNFPFFTSNFSFDTTRAPQSATPYVRETTVSKIRPKQSLDYDVATGILSINGDSIIGTPGATDPILGATVTFPDFQFEGFSLDGQLAAFWPTGNTPYVIAQGGDIFESSAIPILYFDVPDNLFYAPLSDTTLAGVSASSPFFDPTLPNISSEFLNGLDDILNPSSSHFDPLANLYITITPDTNYFALTNGLTSSGGTGAIDKEAPFDPAPVPEPSTLSLLGFGLGGLLVFRRRHKNCCNAATAAGHDKARTGN